MYKIIIKIWLSKHILYDRILKNLWDVVCEDPGNYMKVVEKTYLSKNMMFIK